jgi:hypothetical protein
MGRGQKDGRIVCYVKYCFLDDIILFYGRMFMGSVKRYCGIDPQFFLY